MSEIAAGGAAPAPQVQSGNGDTPPGRPIPAEVRAANLRATADQYAAAVKVAEAKLARTREDMQAHITGAEAALEEAIRQWEDADTIAADAENAAGITTPGSEA